MGEVQNGGDDSFISFAYSADLLVMPMAISQTSSLRAQELHMTPEVIGKIAMKVKAKNLILSHLMARSIRNIDKNVSIIRKYYTGRIIIAEDLLCFPIETQSSIEKPL